MYKVRSTSFYVLVLLVISVNSQISCPEGSLSFGNTCIQVNYIEGCASYTKDAKCDICQYGYSKSGSLCSYNPSPPAGSCCGKFSDLGQCIACAPGLYLNGNTCYSSNIPGCLAKSNGACINCATGFYNSNGICLKKIIGCSKYQGGLCSICDSGYILQAGNCIVKTLLQTTLPPNCLSSNQYTCTACNSNYYLTKDGQCYPYASGCISYSRQQCLGCLNGFKLVGSKCIIEGCDTYTSTGCATCKSPYVSMNGVCTLENCYQSVNGVCSICNSDYRLKGGKCVKPAQEACKQCDKGYFLSDDGKCYLKLIGCSKYSGSGCAQCKSNFYITNYTCVIPGCDKSSISDQGCSKCLSPFIPTNDYSCTVPYCKVINWSGCQNCQSGYIEVNGACIANNPNCVAYTRIDYLTQKCSQCIPSMVLTSSGDCVNQQPGCVYQNNQCISCFYPFIKNSNQQCYIPGCSKYNLKGCQVCAYPYIQVNGECKIANCDQLGSNNLCIKCSSGYQLSKTGCCIANEPYCVNYDSSAVCQTCSQGYLLTSMNKCIKVVAYCTSVDSYGACTSCQVGWKLLQGQCIISDSNCKVPQSQGCAQCNTGYHVENGQCVKNSLYCSTYTQSLPFQYCQSCLDGYYLNEKYQCLVANPGCSYKNGVCISCLSPFMYDSTRKICLINGCQSYSSNGCLACTPPFVLSSYTCSIANCLEYSNTQCVKCQDGFMVGNDGCCVVTNSKCVEYDAYRQCKTCISGYVAFQNSCVKEDKNCLQYSLTSGCNKCLDTYYISPDGICLPKQPGCIYQKSVCTYCQLPFQMNPISNKCQINGCLEMNNSGCLTCKSPFQITKTGECMIPYCLTEKNGICLRCSLGYHLRQGRLCVKDSQNCLKYNDDGDCQLCAKNYLIMSSGQCQLANDNCIKRAEDRIKCLTCSADYFLNTFYQCQKKDSHCIEYNNGVCSKCDVRYFLYQMICFPYSPGCVKYSGKDCVTCKSSYTLANGECFRLNKPLLHMEGEDDQYDFEITPIDITQSKYYIDNLSPISSIAKLIYSSSYSLEYSKATLTDEQGYSSCKGWKAQNSRENQYIGYILENQQPLTFFAVQIESIEIYKIKQFYIEYTVDGINYIRISKLFSLTASSSVQTMYFTGIYAKGIRIVISAFEGWPACRIQFFYYDYIRFKKISNLKSLRYLKDTIDSNFVDRVDNQLYINQKYFFKPQNECINKDVCWTGLQLCQPKNIQSIRVFTGVSQGDKLSYLTQFYIMYSVDGTNFNCYQQCNKFAISNHDYYDLTLSNVYAKNLRVYPVAWVGTPQFTVQYNYQ